MPTCARHWTLRSESLSSPASYGRVILPAVDSLIETRRARWSCDLAKVSAAVANYCDHMEHNEPVELDWITGPGQRLREIACEVAADEGLDLRALYAARLRAIEARNPLGTKLSPDGGEAVEGASTWRELQLAQAAHDRYYHPDVSGLTKADQLRHYAFHVAKLAGAYAEIADATIDIEDFRCRRLPDTLLFGLKLATVTGKRLPETVLGDRQGIERQTLRAA